MPVAVIGKCLGEFDEARIFVRRELHFHEFLDLARERIARSKTRAQHDPGLDRFGADRIGNADHRGHRHRRMLHQRMLDLGRADAIAGGGDDVVLAADVPEIAVLILHAEIAGEQEFAGIFLRRRLRIAPVFEHGQGAWLAHADDAALAAWLLLALVVDDADVKTRRRLAHRAGADRKQVRVAADHEIALGLAKHLMGVDAKGLAHPAEQLAAERFTAGKDAAQLDAGMLHAGLPHQLQRGRRQEDVADAEIGHHLHRRLRLEFSRAMTDQGNAVIPEREQAVDEPADPGPVRRRPHEIAGPGQEVVAHLDIGEMTEHDAVRMQRALRIACRARGVDDQRGIVGGGVDPREVGAMRL